jgi:hypothetical protein
MLAGWRKWLLLIGMALGAGAAALYFRPDPPPPPSPVQIGSTAVALEVQKEGDHLRLVWDRRNPTIRGVAHATLHITDGKQHSVIPLDAENLATGSAVYWPESDRFLFRLDLGDAVGTAGAPVTSEAVAGTTPPEDPPAKAELPKPPVRRPPVRVLPVAKKVVADPATPRKSVKESRVSRVVGRMPLLRRLRKHRQSEMDQF